MKQHGLIFVFLGIFIILLFILPAGSEETITTETFFCPKDDCFAELTNYINNATEIKCAFYDLDNQHIVDLLAEKHAKVVMDNHNFITGFKKDTTSQLMHNKFCIFDSEIAWTGSFNPTKRGAYYNNNNIIVLHSKEIAKIFEQEFSELWNGNFGRKSKGKTSKNIFQNIEIYFCPEDFCTNKVLKELNKAKESIQFMIFSFTSKQVADMLVKKSKQGINIAGVIEKFQKSRWSQYEFLKNNSINIQTDSNKYNMHHKVFIIDNSTVITGSYNPTKNAEFNNDENLVIIHDPSAAEQFLNEFNHITP